ncbi:helix-turn-helix domain-containing protein [Niallia sp. FSL M8-0099]|uniref:helix-turn-helix domain-containing protein n=1 Tax=Niallia sp. FSL M8-0099 TaxID=2954519 RepID=UPI0030FBD331
MSKWAALNKETGEIRDFVEFQASKQRQALGLIKSQEGRKHDFTFTDMTNIHEVIGKIDDKNCGYLLYLQCFISYDGVLVNANHEKTAMSKADIQAVVGLKKTAFSEFFRDMTTNGIIYANEDGSYSVNSAYHFKGTTDNPNVIKSFTTKVRELYTGRNANKLGFVYKLLPYVHFETNTICANPYEKEVADISQLTKQEIAQLTGVSEKTVYTYLRKMKLGDEYVFAEIRRGNERYYKLNPFIFYRKNGRPDATLREMFRLGFSGR